MINPWDLWTSISYKMKYLKIITYPNRVFRAMNTVSHAYRHIILIKIFHLKPTAVFMGVLVASPEYKTTWHIMFISIFRLNIARKPL